MKLYSSISLDLRFKSSSCSSHVPQKKYLKTEQENYEDNLCLFIPDWVETEPTLCVIKETEILICFRDWYNIWKAKDN